MSRENVELVRKALDALNALLRGELTVEAAAEHADPQFEFHMHYQRTFPDNPQHLRIPDFVGFAEDFRSAWDDVVVKALEFIEGPDDRVVTLIRQSGRGRESGVPIEIHYFFVWTIRDGKVRTTEYFRHRADAREAAGLSEQGPASDRAYTAVTVNTGSATHREGNSTTDSPGSSRGGA
jgi:ketosteroid isomerase-like protein